MSNIEVTPAAATAATNKKNKQHASAIQKEITNMEKVRKLLGLTAALNDIPELDEEFKKIVTEATEAISKVSSQLIAARKVYIKDIPIHIKKSSGSSGLNYKTYSAK